MMSGWCSHCAAYGLFSFRKIIAALLGAAVGGAKVDGAHHNFVDKRADEIVVADVVLPQWTRRPRDKASRAWSGVPPKASKSKFMVS